MSSNHVERLESLSIPEPNSGCWLWLGGTRPNSCNMHYGYLQVKGRSMRAHRYAYEVYKGQIPAGLFVCHSCDNPICVNPDHLFIGDAKANADDRDRKGRNKLAIGEKNGKSKITAEQAGHVKWLLANRPALCRTTARRAGVTMSIVRDIADGRSWVSVKPMPLPSPPVQER